MSSLASLGPKDHTVFFQTRDKAMPAGGTPYVILRQLLSSAVILPEDWEKLSLNARQQIQRVQNHEEMFQRLIDHQLLNQYQAARIQAGKHFGLILGNYRVLDRIGAGGMGIVFKAEHMYLRRVVAVKVVPLAAEVVPLYPDQDATLRHRFYAEMRTIAQLQHPNIVAVFDAGTSTSQDQEEPVLHYFAMEYVSGVDLEQCVKLHGPMSMIQGCDLMHQVASALCETNRHELVHRDIKPSNVLMTNEGQAKLLDFGLAMQFKHSRLTEPGAILGTIDYMAPEQVRDASSVDIRADIYALGGTLFWCLTGKKPFPSQGNAVLDLTHRMEMEPPSARDINPEISPEMDKIIRKMMALKPQDRYNSPEEVRTALLPFLQADAREELVIDEPVSKPRINRFKDDSHVAKVQRVLIVDDETDVRKFCRCVLDSDLLQCSEANSGEEALKMLEADAYDLMLLDVNMPGLTGLDVLAHLTRIPINPNMKVLLFSGHISVDEMSQMLLSGADECMTKPFSMVQLRSRVKALLQLKAEQDRAEHLNHHLHKLNDELEEHLQATNKDLVEVRNGLVLALSRVVEYRENETGQHLLRIQKYVGTLARSAAQMPEFSERIDTGYIQLLECCAPLHDIGKMGVPDHILLKPGKLDSEERMLMQAHTTIGADALQEVANQNSSAMNFLQMAIEIARHHHERYDGKGYPDGLANDDIPLSAQLVHICDVYDGLRCRRSYKPAISHGSAVQAILDGSPGQFNPDLLLAFYRCADQFEKIFREFSD